MREAVGFLFNPIPGLSALRGSAGGRRVQCSLTTREKAQGRARSPRRHAHGSQLALPRTGRELRGSWFFHIVTAFKIPIRK